MRNFLVKFLQFSIGLFLIIDELARPFYKPLISYLDQLSIMQKVEVLIGKMPRPVILCLFVIPFAVAEPLKLFGLLRIAEGHIVTGIVILVFAYLASFLIVERIYHAGKGKLLSYAWFAWTMKQVSYVSDLLKPIRVAAREALNYIKQLIGR